MQTTVNLYERMNKLKEQEEALKRERAELSRLQAEEELKAQKRVIDNKEALSMASLQGDIAKVRALLGHTSIDQGVISYPTILEFDTQELKDDYERRQKKIEEEYHDPIQSAIMGDHPDILRVLIHKASEELEPTIWNYNRWAENFNNHHSSDFQEEEILNTNKSTIISNVVNILFLSDNLLRNTFYYHTLKDYETKNHYSMKLPNFYSKRLNSLLIEAILFKAEKCAALLINEFNANPSTYFYDNAASENAAPSLMLRGSALTLAIDLGLSSTALLLIKKGAKLEHEYGNHATQYSYRQRATYPHISLHTVSTSYPTVTCWDGERDFTPLMLAAKKNNYEVAKALLEAGANPKAKDSNDRIAHDLATDPELKKLLALPNTLQARLDVISLHDTVPSIYNCIISGDVMEKPIAYEGEIFDLESLKAKNKFTKDDNRVDHHGKPISQEKYAAILSQKILTRLQGAIVEFVEKQEEIDRQKKSANRKSVR